MLRVLDRFGDRHRRGGAEPLPRVVIVTDEQAWGGSRGEDPTSAEPARVPVYIWNVAGYRYGHGPSGAGNRQTPWPF